MFNFFIVFAFTILLIFGLIKIVDLIFIYNQKIKISFFKLDFIILSASLLFLLTSIFFLFGVNQIVNLSPFLNVAENRQLSNLDIALEDCPLLLNTIQQTENNSDLQEDHRYIEEEVPLFTIKLDYQKGAQQLRKKSSQYSNLRIKKNTAEHIDKIAQKIQEKAQLFEQRVSIKEDEINKKEIYKLLNKMDVVTEERQQLINLVKQKCIKTAI